MASTAHARSGQEATGGDTAQHQTLVAEVLEDTLGPRWDERRHVALDFSSPIYCLETLISRDGGLLNPRLNLSNLLTLDISNNALTDIDSVVSVANGFKRLKTLKASHNLIAKADLVLPTLISLDLSSNQLTRLPWFEGIRNVEELILSQNQIRDSNLQSFVMLGNLRALDLSNNQISTLPSNFIRELDHLKNLTKLTKVDFRRNDCTSWFPEYAAVFILNAISAGQHIAELDGDIINLRTHADLQAAGDAVLARLGDFDATYMERQEAAASRPQFAKYAIKARLAGEDGDATIGRLTGLLEKVLTVPTGAAAEVGATFYDICTRVCRATAVRGMEEEARVTVFWKYYSTSEKARKNASREMVQRAQLAVEHSEEARPLILRGIASLCIVTEGSLAHEVSVALARLARQEFTSQTEGDCGGQAAEVIAEVVVPSLLEFSGQERMLMDVLTGLVTGTECLAMALALSSCVPLLADLLTLCGPTASLCKVLSMVCLAEENCSEAAGQGIPQAKVAGAIIGVLSGMIRSCEEAMSTCCNNYHLVDLLLPAMKEELADPVILAASCTGVRVILENPQQRQELLRYVTEEMRGFESLLQYLGGPRYTAMCDRAELALKNEDKVCPVSFALYSGIPLPLGQS
ncbi:uncharacterized protein LOC34622225 [Cyclospora cayetanensis]|uniref:Uncharacterized protein LOC34622225 n=1 Tax=Cyclospora cayetanensis TaxID=88456 RepID=A0A6P6S3P7_9EIME|nr:uncharacterized protein LOC34622225 [Cyclospora cayetanensis]